MNGVRRSQKSNLVVIIYEHVHVRIRVTPGHLVFSSGSTILCFLTDIFEIGNPLHAFNKIVSGFNLIWFEFDLDFVITKGSADYTGWINSMILLTLIFVSAIYLQYSFLFPLIFCFLIIGRNCLLSTSWYQLIQTRPH